MLNGQLGKKSRGNNGYGRVSLNVGITVALSTLLLVFVYLSTST